MKQRESMSAPGRAEPLRMIALSDGLFATVLTLLVLDLRTPGAAVSGSANALAFVRSVAPHFFSYLLTFLVTGLYWQAHQRDFQRAINYDRFLLGYNLLFLLFVGLFPFTTAALSLGDLSTSSYSFYWAIYATNIALAGLMLTLTWLYAATHGQIEPSLTSGQRRRLISRRLVTPAVFLLSIGMEFLFPGAFLGPYTLLIIPIVRWVVDRSFPSDPDDQSRPPTWADRLWRAGAVLLWLLIFALAIWALSR